MMHNITLDPIWLLLPDLLLGSQLSTKYAAGKGVSIAHIGQAAGTQLGLEI